MKNYILSFDNKCYVSNFNVKYIDNEKIIDNVLLCKNINCAFTFIDSESALHIAYLINRLYDFDIVVEEVIR